MGSLCLNDNFVFKKLNISLDLIFFGNTMVEFPSFEPVSGCKLPPPSHPTKQVYLATTGVLDGKVFRCGGELSIDRNKSVVIDFCLLHQVK